MHKKYKEYIIFLLFGLLTVFVFRNYFLKQTIPFPSNLLVSFYNPWIAYTWKGYSNIPNKPIGFDNLRIFYPLRNFTTEQFKHGEWPLWNPYNFSGTIHLATYQAAVFHPLSFLFFLLPQIDAWSIIIILQPFFSCLFIYLFLREMSFSRKAGFFGAITFGFSGYMIVLWEESFMSVYSSIFLPLILYSIEKIYKKLSPFHFSLLTISLACSVLSGWFQMTFYVWFFSVVWILFRHVTGNKKQFRLLLWIFAAYIFAILISAVHLFPSIEGYLYSARGNTDAKFIFDIYFLSFSDLVTFLTPDFFGNPATYNYFGKGFYYEKVLYIGILPLFFIVYELLFFNNITKEEIFFKSSWFITLSLAFALPTSWLILYHLKLPFLSVMLPSRILYLSMFLGSVLATFGIERYLKNASKRIYFVFAFFAMCFLASFWYLFYNPQPTSFFSIPTENKMISLRNLILSTAVFIASIISLYVGTYRKLRLPIYYFLLLLTFLPMAYFSNKYLYFSDRSFVYPQTPPFNELKKITKTDRFWATGEAYVDRNFATYFHLFSPEGYDSLYIKRYGELLFAAQNKGKFSKQIPRTDATIANVFPSEILDDPYRGRLLSLLGLRYIVIKNYQENESKKGIVNSQEFNLVWKDHAFAIYEYTKALPRAFLVGSYLVEKDEQKILDAVFSKNTDLGETAILEESLPITIKTDSTSNSDIISYEPNKVVVRTNSKENAILFLSDNFYPGWKTFVDNTETKMYRTNYSFRGVAVPKGLHTVSFVYKPVVFYIGLYTTILSLLVLLFGSIYLRRRQI